MVDVAATVIIPARNERATIGPIVKAFSEHPETKGNVYVGIDSETTDDTSRIALRNGAYPVKTFVHGKGQVVWQTMRVITTLLDTYLTNPMILCDGDYTGLTTDHIDAILRPPAQDLVLGIPDWPDCEVPDHVTRAWPLITGFRRLPWTLVPANAHGYLLETQINSAAVMRNVPIGFQFMHGLKSPFQWPLPERRMKALIADGVWGKANGLL
jgi:hypothetical protein